MAPACLFLAAKVEEQPRKLEHVIKVAHACLNRDHNTPTPDPKTEVFITLFYQNEYYILIYCFHGLH